MTFPFDEIVKHCREEYPKEACGIVVLSDVYRYTPCKNIAENLHSQFTISPQEYAQAEDSGEIVTIVHSHTNGNASASDVDIIAQKSSGIDWLIVGVDSSPINELYWIKNIDIISPLYGRGYVWQVHDCGSFIRDFYKEEFKIELLDFHRPVKFWEEGLELYLDCYKKSGFVQIEYSDLEYGDIILFALGTSVTTHGAVYVGDNKISHHYNGRLSCCDVLGKYYIDRATRFLRHKDRL